MGSLKFRMIVKLEPDWPSRSIGMDIPAMTGTLFFTIKPFFLLYPRNNEKKVAKVDFYFLT